jgi:hypothetical protein
MEAKARRATQVLKFCVALRAYGARFKLPVGLRRRQFMCRPPGYLSEPKCNFKKVINFQKTRSKPLPTLYL